jgi:hypothetical protein
MQQHSNALVEDDQEWEFVNGIEKLTLPEEEKFVAVPMSYSVISADVYSGSPIFMTPYSMTIGKHTREIKIEDIEDRNPEFAPYFDEKRCFKHNDWPESTKRIILGYILQEDVLLELKAKDPQKTRLLHFISLLKFREYVRHINITELRLTAEMELGDVVWALPFADVLRTIVNRPEWCAFDQDNALLMNLVHRVNAWGDNIPAPEISRIIQSWPTKGMSPTNHVLKFAIELKLELQGCRLLVRNMADQVTEAMAKSKTNEQPAKTNEQPTKAILSTLR